MLLPDREPLELDLGGPYSPKATIYAAAMMAELARYLNHATMYREALRHPSEADRLIRELSSAASRLEVAGGKYPNAALATDVVRLRLEMAAADARRLQGALDSAASVTCDLAAAETEGDDGD